MEWGILVDGVGRVWEGEGEGGTSRMVGMGD